MASADSRKIRHGTHSTIACLELCTWGLHAGLESMPLTRTMSSRWHAPWRRPSGCGQRGWQVFQALNVSPGGLQSCIASNAREVMV